MTMDMETMKLARHLGSTYAVVFAGIGCLCALLMLFLWGGMGIFSKSGNSLGIAVGVVGLFLAAYFFGQWAGVLMAARSKPAAVLIGILTAFAVLEAAIVAGSLVGFLSEKRDFGLWQHFIDYVFKPTYWVTLGGLIPTIILGLLFGLKVWNALAKR